MARAAVLVACLLALMATGARALTCGPSYMDLQYVAPVDSTDPMALCLTSMRIELGNAVSGECSIRITSKQSNGAFVPSLWTADDYFVPWGIIDSQNVECPTQGPWIKAVQGSGTTLEAIRRAIIRGLAGFVYGLNQYGQYNYPLDVPDLDFLPGKLVVKRVDALNLIYAISFTNVQPADIKQDDDVSPVYEVPNCRALQAGDNRYDAFLMGLCLSNEDAHLDCPGSSYGAMVVKAGAVNAWNMSMEAFKLCALCPAGTQGTGFGCTACNAGEFSTIGGFCTPCPEGTYSNAGSSMCIPCPSGSYAPRTGMADCLQCPEDTFSWVPGGRQCMRCVSGLPELCDQDDVGACPSGNVSPQEMKSSQGTHIAAVSAMTTTDNSQPDGPVCDLDASHPNYEIKAFTKCRNWGTSLQMAFTVYGDCSIQMSPISDPTCSDPNDNATIPYGAIQQRAYYHYDYLAGSWKISSLLNTARNVNKHVLLSIFPDSGPGPSDVLNVRWIPATTDPLEGRTNPLIFDNPDPAINPEVCATDMIMVGGSILGAVQASFTVPAPGSPPAGAWTCPGGSYFHSTQVCPVCPAGSWCPGGDGLDAKVIPCDPDTYNGMLGLGIPCTACPASGAYTTYAAAQQCDVAKVDLECQSFAGTGSYAYDKASQECKQCPAGTWRQYGASLECTPCPEGHYSAQGDATCSPCPPGEVSPNLGLPDQFDITGHHCLLCPVGSMALRPGSEDPDWDGAGPNADGTLGGATYCDACPQGYFMPENDPTASCRLCDEDTYRTGQATPENNVCKPVPAGYRLTDGEHDSITLCEKGSVSFWMDVKDRFNNPKRIRIPVNDEFSCIACSQLDGVYTWLNAQTWFTPHNTPLEPAWAHTFAPRKGMTQCVPCPGGTVPKVTLVQSQPRTAACEACGNGRWRDPYKVASTCDRCGAGKEVGPSSKMSCTQCRPGTYMPLARSNLNTFEANTCALCPRNQYRPTFGATSCLLCPRGTQTTNLGNVECTSCPIGYFNNEQGSGCVPAPVGTFVNTTGAYVTTPCPRGTWNNEPANDNCNPCAPGKYSNTVGAKECKTCPAGTYSAGQATTCTDCRPGYAAPAGAAACSPCKAGTYAPDGKSATCKMCPRGFQCPTNAMKLEGPCPKGTFSNKEGNKICTPCPTNTYSLGGGTAAAPQAVMACIKCSPGTNTRGLVGQSKCQVIRPQVKRLLL